MASMWTKYKQRRASRASQLQAERLHLPDDLMKVDGPANLKGAQTARMKRFLESTRQYMHNSNATLELSEVISSRESEDTRSSASSKESLDHRASSIFNPRCRRQLHPVTLSLDQIQEYENAFKQYDMNGDGVISVHELSMLLETIGLKPSEAEVVDMIATVDANGDGVLSRCEFLKLMSNKHNPVVTPQHQYEAIFNVFDADNNGNISRNEFKDMLFSIGQRCSEEELDSLICEMDTNRDGMISQREFLSVFLNCTPASPTAPPHG